MKTLDNKITTVKVVEMKSRPQNLPGYSMIMRGIRTKEAAEKWGAKYGFSQVYWIKAEEKVYGVKPLINDGVQLLQTAEV